MDEDLRKEIVGAIDEAYQARQLLLRTCGDIKHILDPREKDALGKVDAMIHDIAVGLRFALAKTAEEKES